MISSLLLNRPFLPLSTERLILRPLKEEDAHPMATLANDLRIAERVARLPHPYALSDAHKFIAFAQEGIKQGTHISLAVIRRSDQTFMGVIGLEEELGFWLGVKFWGQGYGKEAMKALVHFAFFALKQDKLTTSALLYNTPSRRIFESLGFTQTGTKKISSLGYVGTKEAATYALSYTDFLDNSRRKKRPLLWVAAAALINENGQLLLTERPFGKSLAGLWELPGGKLEPDETPEAALIRELREELMIEVKEEDLEPLSFSSHRYETCHLFMPFYLCRKWYGIPRGGEGQKLAWVSYADLANMPTPSGDILLFHNLADTLRSQGIWEK